MIFTAFKNKSFLFTLVVADMTINSAHAQNNVYVVNPNPCLDCDHLGSSSSFNNANSMADGEASGYLAAISIIGRPIKLPPINKGHDEASSSSTISNATQFHTLQVVAVDETEIEDQEEEVVVDSNGEAIRFYPTWSDGELCSSKKASLFDAWEESYGSLDECCDMAFSWDYDACMQSA